MKLFEFLRHPKSAFSDAVRRQIEAIDQFNAEVAAARKRVLNGHHKHESDIVVEVKDGSRNPDL